MTTDSVVYVSQPENILQATGIDFEKNALGYHCVGAERDNEYKMELLFCHEIIRTVLCEISYALGLNICLLHSVGAHRK
jgi:hypothetical protein